MSAKIRKHYSMIGYVLLVLIAVVAIELHHNETTGEIKDFNHKACTRSVLLAENQKVVLQTLQQLLKEEAEEHQDHPELKEQLDTILERLNQVPTFECEEGR